MTLLHSDLIRKVSVIKFYIVYKQTEKLIDLIFTVASCKNILVIIDFKF